MARGEIFKEDRLTKYYLAQRRHCKNCGTDVVPDMPGNGWVEFLLWCCYLLPGMIYSVWRRSAKNRTVCPRCRNPHTLP